MALYVDVSTFRYGNKCDHIGPGPGQYNVTGLSAKGIENGVVVVAAAVVVRKSYVSREKRVCSTSEL